jgi:hypothetical protein
MKLSFLGKPYTASQQTIEACETDNTVTFLGCRSRVKTYSVTHNPVLGEELSFMGRRYTR